MAQTSSSGTPRTASSDMTFFVTSTGSGKGADFGGLAGADKHCQTLAAAAGAGGHTWRAYLSTQGAGAVNARDRIGKGPWRNAKGVVVANRRRRAARHQQPGQADGADGKGRCRQRTRRHAEPARHPDRLAAGRHRVRRRRRHDVRQLDEERRGQRDARPPRPDRHQSRPGRERVVELVAQVAPAAAIQRSRRRAAPVICTASRTN